MSVCSYERMEKQKSKNLLSLSIQECRGYNEISLYNDVFQFSVDHLNWAPYVTGALFRWLGIKLRPAA